MVIAKEFVLPVKPEDYMGEVVTTVVLENLRDRENAEAGLIARGDVRNLILPIVVDTGASQLVLPEEMVSELGLRRVGQTIIEYADGRREERPLAGYVIVRVLNREAGVHCIVGPAGTEPLLGQVPLETLDLLVDCGRLQLVPRPESPFMPSYKVKSFRSRR